MANKKKSDNWRNRNHFFELYPDNESHSNALEMITKSYDYALCLHDRDKKADGTLKKPHYHVVVRFGNAVWRSAICKQLGIEDRWDEEPRSLDKCLAYLMHYHDSDKSQYDFSEVKGPLNKRLAQYLQNQEKSEAEKVNDLIDFIDSHPCPVNITYVARWATANGYWSEFRRSASIIIAIIKEHNEPYFA